MPPNAATMAFWTSVVAFDGTSEFAARLTLNRTASGFGVWNLIVYGIGAVNSGLLSYAVTVVLPTMPQPPPFLDRIALAMSCAAPPATQM